MKQALAVRPGDAARLAARLLGQVVVPCLLAACTLRYLVPTELEAHGTPFERIARVAGEHLAISYGILLVVFALIARYWAQFLEPSVDGAARRSARREAVELALVLVLATLLALAAKATVGSYRVLSASMLPTFEPGDVLGGNKLAFGGGPLRVGGRPLARGDLIVFPKPPGIEGPSLLVKRVIGLPGDRISMSGQVPVINGERVESCDAGPYFYPLSQGGGVIARLYVEFLGERPHLALYAPEPHPWPVTYQVKPGEVFVLGDNRSNSLDSRAWNAGAGAGLPVATIEARADWWLFTEDRRGHLTLGELFRSFDMMPRLEGLDTNAMRDRIQHCLREKAQKAGQSHGT